MKQLYVFLLAVFCVCSAVFGQTAIYVNASTGNDATGNGTSGNPYKTVTKAMTVSSTSGDSIKVAAGTYNVALGETFPITMKSGRILIGTAGALTTILDASGAQSRVVECSGNSASTIIQGLTITGGHFTNFSNGSNSNGGGIYMDNGDQTIVQQNIITRDTVAGYHFNQVTNGHNGGNCYGGGMYIVSSSPTVRNNVISYNIAYGGGGESYLGGFSGVPSGGGSAYGAGIAAGFASAGTVVVNNTFVGNKVLGGLGGATNNGINPGGSGGNATSGGLDAGSNVVVKNNIFYGDTAIAGTGGGGSSSGTIGSATDGALTGFTAANYSYNMFFNNIATTNANGGTLGSNTVTSDPQFLSMTNFHFPVSSPAYHAGTATGAPTDDLDGTARANPPSIGAFEGADPLPVELVSFTGMSDLRGTTLRWSTATETNNYGFEVEKGVRDDESGIRSWNNIGFVAGGGTTNAPKEYSYTDKNSSVGKYIYRLKQIDRNGSFTYSKEVSVNVGAMPIAFSLSQNYPNPFNPTTDLRFTIPARPAGGADLRLVSLTVYDILGKNVATLVDESLRPGTYSVRWDATNFPNGVYVARLVSGESRLVSKMVLMK